MVSFTYDEDGYIAPHSLAPGLAVLAVLPRHSHPEDGNLLERVYPASRAERIGCWLDERGRTVAVAAAAGRCCW